MEILPYAILLTFQSTLPRRERPPISAVFMSTHQFQSTLPRRERHRSSRLQLEIGWNFNPRSREGSDTAKAPAGMPDTDFNPRSREGSDRGREYLHHNIRISIHAPAKGATHFVRSIKAVNMISIHAPAKGATYVNRVLSIIKTFQSTLPRRERLAESTIVPQTYQFQSTLPRRERLHPAKPDKPSETISIHAPAKGAT